jgi:hypothetical protein
MKGNWKRAIRLNGKKKKYLIARAIITRKTYFYFRTIAYWITNQISVQKYAHMRFGLQTPVTVGVGGS